MKWVVQNNGRDKLHNVRRVPDILAATATIIGDHKWILTNKQKQKWLDVFRNADKDKDGIVSGE